jgi:ribosomal-protein-alanine N-acetyltransferase
VEIREGTADDYEDYVRLVPELGVDDPIATREHFASELVARTLIAVEEGRVVGYATFEILAEAGYVRNLVSDPGQRRRGVGLALMEEMGRRFGAVGAREWRLNVFPKNVPAVALYERCGMRIEYRTFILRVGAEVELEAAPLELAIAPVEAIDDAVVEERFGLLRGQLASARSRPSRRVMQLQRKGALAGVAVFSTSIPGAFPFRTVEPAIGPAFVSLLRPLAPEGARFVQLGVEADAALRDVLLARGARLHYEIAHMRGAL